MDIIKSIAFSEPRINQKNIRRLKLTHTPKKESSSKASSFLDKQMIRGTDGVGVLSE